MSDDILASLPSAGMVRVEPADCQELLRLCTVMGWRPKLPLLVMRDDSARRWFLRGDKGKQDYWIRDTDIEALKRTPMYAAVATAKPYGSVAATLAEMVEPLKMSAGTEAELRRRAGEEGIKSLSTATEIELRQRVGQERLQALASHLGEPLNSGAVKPDPVEQERAEAAKARLEAEEKLRRIDAWEE